MDKVVSSVFDDHNYSDVYENEYAWLPQFFEQIGFMRMGEYVYWNNSITDSFSHDQKGLLMKLTIEFSPRRRTWDVISLKLSLYKSPSGEKHWSIWRSGLDTQQLKDEVQLSLDAFVTVNASWSDDKEPIYISSRSGKLMKDSQGKLMRGKEMFAKPELRGEEYCVLENERWIHAKTLGELYVEAYSLGGETLSDIRQVKVFAGFWDGEDKNGRPIGGIMWADELGGVVSPCPLEATLQKYGD